MSKFDKTIDFYNELSPLLKKKAVIKVLNGRPYSKVYPLLQAKWSNEVVSFQKILWRVVYFDGKL